MRHVDKNLLGCPTVPRRSLPKLSLLPSALMASYAMHPSLPLAPLHATARITMNEDNHHQNNITVMLPDALVAHALEWLPFSDRRRYFSCSHALVRSCRDYESLLQSLVLSRPPPLSVLENLTNLHTLNMGEWATDDFLRNLSSITAAPNLKHLFMTRSMHITDAGLEFLTRNPLRCQTLETIDITYCRNTTYAGTFPLRDKLTALKLLRRQPQWMDGTYETPFENDSLHTYWADGTFYFLRDNLKSGYVCDYFLWDSTNENRVGDKLQYNNLDLAEVLPVEFRQVFRPGVSLLRLPQEQAVLVAQTLRGMYPPKDYPTLEQKDLVPMGESIYLDVVGNVTNDEEMRHTMLSRIPMRPLESLMPPWDIVEKNRMQIAKMTSKQLNSRWNEEELTLHTRMGGTFEAFMAIRPLYDSM